MKSPHEDAVIGYFGFPRRDLFRSVRERYGFELPLVDLDVDLGAPDSGILPPTTCRIVSNIVDNAMALRDRLVVIVAAIGEDKCDRGRHAAWILAQMGFTLVESRWSRECDEDRPIAWACAKMPLGKKIDRIMATVVDPQPLENAPTRCNPSHGFWGVPPHDPRILDIFPETTHVYGWIRCVEAGRPSDIALECFVDEGVPTVFFTQSFCAKQDLAHHLASRYGGLAIDCHREINDSILAKIEAFIELSRRSV